MKNVDAIHPTFDGLVKQAETVLNLIIKKEIATDENGTDIAILYAVKTLVSIKRDIIGRKQNMPDDLYYKMHEVFNRYPKWKQTLRNLQEKKMI